MDFPTDPPAAGPAAPPPLLDTPETRDALACPLCGYSLRGLAAAGRPQCPECGYAFDWTELLRARQHDHPYLFEHHPRRNARSFARTFAAGTRPSRFWSSLNAGHAVRPRRLFVYWLVVATVTILTGLAGAVVAHGSMAYYQNVVWMGGPPGTAALLREFCDNLFGGHVLEAYVLIAALLWPWLTMATLLLFRASMRRVRVRPAHVLRCVVYSADAFVWIGAAVATLALLRYYNWHWLGPRRMWDETPSDRQTAACFLLLMALASYRLGVAYRRYLRFDQPWSTAVASQVVVFLFLTTALSIFYPLFFKLLPGG